MKKTSFAGRVVALAVLTTIVASALAGAAPTVRAAQEDAPIIVIDISHGQEIDHGGSFATLDAYLAGNLTEMGYEVIWALAGINATILENATGLILPSMYGTTAGFLPAEVSAIASWFNAGHKFLWVGYDSDFPSSTSGQWINDNATAVLEAVGSHVYGEPTAIEDVDENVAGQAYRTISNVTSDDPYVADIVTGVTRVMMHGPTILYGSDSSTPGENVSAVDLETHTIDNVYPLLYSSPSAYVKDGDTPLKDPFAHEDGAHGSFVTAAIEVEAGDAGNGVIVVSGSKPCTGYHPMYDYFYNPEVMDGYNLVNQAIDWGVQTALFVPTTTTTTTTTTTSSTTTTTTAPDNTMLYLGAGIGVVVVIVIIAAVLRRK